MNKLTITLFGKELKLRFGGLAWEYFALHSQEHKGLVKSMALLIHSAILNEEEITGQSQNVSFNELLGLVDSAYSFEAETGELKKAEKMFSEMNTYKEFLKKTSETGKKKQSANRKK